MCPFALQTTMFFILEEISFEFTYFITFYIVFGLFQGCQLHMYYISSPIHIYDLYLFQIFIYLFTYSWLCWVFVSVRGLSVVVASGGHSSSRWAGLSLSWPLLLGAQAPDAQAQQLWLMGLVAPRHVGSSQTRARTRFPCIDRQILNHWATREALYDLFYNECFLDCILIHVTSTMAFISLMDFVFLPFSSSF